ncbi:GNAT family N-acetyltransferase [Streptomyces sp. CA-106131]|uniref:GNAT family N-acetyltransferase n=1 Tax=Streptomyces sp. CA-106131 TaxID=3240045 RepID=UPI003D8B16AF
MASQEPGQVLGGGAPDIEHGGVCDTGRHVRPLGRIFLLQDRSYQGPYACPELGVHHETPGGDHTQRPPVTEKGSVGFVMLSWKPPAGPYKGRHFLWRLLVDKRYQGRGIGQEALMQVATLVRADGATELPTSYEPGDGEPWPFYQKFGFEPTGEIDDGEIVLRLTFPAR